MSAHTRLGPFAVEGELGRGGMGVVWAGRHVPSGLPVAVKVMPEHTDPSAVADEVRAVARLDHPGIVPVHDHGRLEADGPLGPAGAPWLVMGRAHGGSVLDAPPTDWPAIRALLLAILDALAHAHARGVIHRDLKPPNVLWATPSGPPWLTDFGLAHLGDDGTLTRRTAGTPYFMAPEQCSGDLGSQGPWTDLWGLGCMTWWLVSGHPPWGHVSPREVRRAHLYAPLPVLSARMPVPAGLGAWLDVLLQRPTEARFPSAAEAAWALSRLEDAAGAAWIPATWSSASGLMSTFLLDPHEAPLDDDALPEAQIAEPRAPAAVPFRGVPRPVARRTRFDDVGAALIHLRRPPLVGRRSAWILLEQTLQTVRDVRATRRVRLEGPPGCGASTLARAFAEQASEAGAATALVVTGDGGMADAAEHLLRIRHALPARRASRLQRWVDRHPDGPDAEMLECLVAGTLPDASAAATLWALAGTVGAGSVLVVDGAPRAGRALAQAASSRPDVPVMLVTAGCPPDDLPGAVLQLGPLRSRHVAAWVDAVLGLDDDDARWIAEHTGGWPRAVAALLEGAVRTGAVVPGRGGMVLDRARVAALPVDNPLAARVDALPDGILPALAAAAVCGLEVEAHRWEAVARIGGAKALSEAQERLHRDGLVAGDRARWRWLHPDLPDRVLARAGDAARWHLAAAEALSASDDPDDLVERGRHLLAGGRPADAWAPWLYGVRGMLHAARMRACLDAIEPWLAAAPADHPDRDEAERLQLVALAGRGDPSVPDRCRAILDRPDAPPRLRGVAHAQLADRLRRSGHFEEALAHARALRALEAAGLEGGEADALEGKALTALGRLDEGIAMLERAIAVFLDADRASWAVSALAFLGVVAVSGGHGDEARRWYARAWALRDRVEAPHTLVAVMAGLADIQQEDGDLEGARATISDGLQLLLRHGHAAAPMLRLKLALLYHASADHAEAETQALRARRAFVAQRAKPQLACADVLLAAIAARIGQWTDCRARLETGDAALTASGYSDKAVQDLLEEVARSAGDAGEVAVAARAAEMAETQATILARYRR